MESQPPVAVYSPEPQLRRPLKLARAMWADLLASKHLAWRLFIRNISAQYRQTALGFVWAFIPPLAMAAVWIFLSSQKVVEFGETALPYPVFVLVGTVLWQVFVDALNSPLKLVTSSRQMLTKINFPREALILAGLGEIVFNFCVRLLLLIVVFFWFQVPVPGTIVLAPVGVVMLIALGLMVGLFLAPVGLLFQDVQYGVATMTYLWFFLTPVVYPAPASGPVATVVAWNPVAPLLLATRDWATVGGSSPAVACIVVTAATLVCLVFGWVLYRLAMPHLIARISA